MFEDLVKIAALGYVGSKMSQEMSKRTDERKREQAEAIQQLKNFAFVVYDGKAPYTAAQNLVKYLTDEGYESAAVDPELYHSRLERPPIMEHSRIIIIGHHDFTKEQMTTVDLQSDQYGLKFGATGRRYVLRARRSDLRRRDARSSPPTITRRCPATGSWRRSTVCRPPLASEVRLVSLNMICCG